jgi:two-component system chemotaxis response regulator CheB
MATPPVIAIGASAGGVDALRRLLRQLPADLPAAVAVVVHMGGRQPSLLAGVLSASGPLRAVEATDGEPLRAGRVLTAAPGCHLMIEREGVRLFDGPRENLHRPSVDVLFRSLAASHGARGIGVVLSGALDDGTAGLIALKRAGGLAAVQDPADAVYPDMPSSALRYISADATGTAEALGAHLVALVARAAEATAPEPDLGGHGTPVATINCPDCEAALVEDRSLGVPAFRGPSGHRFTLTSMVAGHDDALERALWSAQRALTESAALAARVALRARENGRRDIAERFAARAEQQRRHISILRGMITAERQGAAGPPD